MRQQVLHSLGKAHVPTGAKQSLQPDQHSGASKADREDIQRTKVSVFSPGAGGAPAAVGRPSRGSVLVAVWLCATQPSPAGSPGAGPWPPARAPPAQEAAAAPQSRRFNQAAGAEAPVKAAKAARRESSCCSQGAALGHLEGWHGPGSGTGSAVSRPGSGAGARARHFTVTSLGVPGNVLTRAPVPALS